MSKLKNLTIIFSLIFVFFSVNFTFAEEVQISSSLNTPGIIEWIGSQNQSVQNSQDYDNRRFDLWGVYIDKEILSQSGNTEYLSKADNEEQFRILLERLHYFPEPYWDQFMADLKEKAELIDLYFGKKMKFVVDTDISKARVSRNKYFQKVQQESWLDTIFFIVGVLLICLSFVMLILGVVEASGYLGSMVGDVMGFRTEAQKDQEKASLGTFFGFSISWIIKCAIILIVGFILANSSLREYVFSKVLEFFNIFIQGANQFQEKVNNITGTIRE